MKPHVLRCECVFVSKCVKQDVESLKKGSERNIVEGKCRNFGGLEMRLEEISVD